MGLTDKDVLVLACPACRGTMKFSGEYVHGEIHHGHRGAAKVDQPAYHVGGHGHSSRAREGQDLLDPEDSDRVLGVGRSEGEVLGGLADFLAR